MSHPRTSSSLPANGAGSPVTVDGITYVWNTVTGRWETQISKNIDIVTKDTQATYTLPLSTFTTPLGASESEIVASKPPEELLSVLEVDQNFIQLKQGIASLERELTYWSHEIEEESARIDTLNSQLFLNSGQPNFVPVGGGAFTGSVSGLTAATSSDNAQFATTAFVKNKLGEVDTNFLPSSAGNFDFGSSSEFWRHGYINSIYASSSVAKSTYTSPGGALVQYYPGTSLGSTSRAFEYLYAKEGVFGGGTITIGEASLSETTSGGVLIPTGSSIGVEENEIPTSFGNTLVDERFAEDSQVSDRLVGTFTAGGTIAVNDPVKLTTAGTVQTVNSTNTSEAFVGFAIQSATITNDVNIVLNGLVSGFSSLTTGDAVHLELNGTLTQTKSATTQKIGIATSASQIFLFSQSNLDTYVLSRSKIGLDDISATVAGAASGTGSLAYNSTTGAFTYTPPDLSPYATTVYVNQQISNVVDAAPGALDTLNELAAALGDDPNFSTTITNTLATKAPLNSPALTGFPTAPTPGTTDNSTKIATTAFVKSLAGAQEVGDLSDVDITSIQDGQVLAFSSSANKFINQNQSGIGSGTGGTVTFIVDGGTATTVSNDIIIFLDGGGA